MTANGYVFQEGHGKNVPKLDCNDGCTTLNALKTTELCTCTLKEWILWYLNYISKKQFRKKSFIDGRQNKIIMRFIIILAQSQLGKYVQFMRQS